MKLQPLTFACEMNGLLRAFVICAICCLAVQIFAAPIGVTLAMSPEKMKLTVCSDSIVRVMYSPMATMPIGQDFAVTNQVAKFAPFQVADEQGKVTVAKRMMKVAVDKTTGVRGTRARGL